MKIANLYKNYKNRKRKTIEVSFHFNKGDKSGYGHDTIYICGKVNNNFLKDILMQREGFESLVVLNWKEI